MSRLSALLEAYREDRLPGQLHEVAKDLKSLLDTYNDAIQHVDDVDPGDSSDATFKSLFKAINSLALVMRSAAEYHGVPDRAVRRMHKLANRIKQHANDLEGK